MENYQGAAAKINTLNLEKLSPYERGTVERILFSISYAQDKFEEARGHEAHRPRMAPREFGIISILFLKLRKTG